jgi:hypothetical protein
VTIRNDAVGGYKEPAATRDGVAARIERLDGDGGRFNAFYEFGKKILRRNSAHEKHERHKKGKKRSQWKPRHQHADYMFFHA